MARQSLVHYTGHCFTCGRRNEKKNVMAWAHNHANHNPGHVVAFETGYVVSTEVTPEKNDA